MGVVIEDRVAHFWSKVDRSGGCWLWTAGLNVAGYGKFWDGTRTVQAHRFAYESDIGPVPDGLQIDHLCRVRSCVNPTHLEPVTARENLLRGDTLNSAQIKRTNCPQGHAYDSANTRVVHGRRFCRSCGRARARQWYRDHNSAKSRSLKGTK